MRRASLRWRFALFVLFPLMRILLRLKVRGRENLSTERGQIIACNHTSQVDPLVVGFASGLETWFLAKDELFRWSRLFAGLLQSYHALPVSRGFGDLGVLRKSGELLSRGRTLVLFPEGTRSKDGTLQAFRAGVALLSIANQVPVVPAFIVGVRQSFVPWLADPDIVRHSQRVRPGSMKFRVASLWNSRVTIRFGAPLSPGGFERTKSDYERFSQRIYESLQALARRED